MSYASWGIILDDIIYPDGQTAMGTLGGGGLYASSGMRLWHKDAAVCAAVGADFAASSLTPHGFDNSGLLVTGLPTPRAWQVLEEDGRRTQVPRVSSDDWFEQLVRIPVAQPIPSTLKAIHFLGRGDEPEEKFVQALAAAGVVISAEPLVDENNTAEEIEALKRCLPYFELFSPDEFGAKALVGDRPIKEQLRALAVLGPRVVALRQGKDGALIYEKESDQFWRVPATAAQVVDVTGAGNAFCGGLLVGWLETKDIRQAAAQASVSAAYVIEQVGPPLINAAVMAAAKTRAAEVVQLIDLVQE
ncbi:MAG: sugar/nucleoside kinase (ribokinase family) [Cellvibrionaceae bacterium]|jgi:sugar/nucleoside kinase (ribokinase family)